MSFTETAAKIVSYCDLSAEREEEKRKQKVFTWLCFASVMFFMLPGILFNDVPMRDVSLRYAPMADALARGDWLYAFHPRVPMLFPMLAGAVGFVFRCDGFIACKTASALLLAFAVFPFVRLMRSVCPGRTWKLAAFFFVFSAPIMEFAFEGLRDSGKVLILLLLAEAMLSIYRVSKKWSGYLLLGLYSGCGILFRSEMLLVVLILLMLAMYWEYGHSKLPRRTIAALGVLFLLFLMPIVSNYLLIGRAVPDFRYDWLMRNITGEYANFRQFALLYVFGASVMIIGCKLLRLFKLKTVLILTCIAAAALSVLGILRVLISEKSLTAADVTGYFVTFLEGCNILLIVPAAAGLLLKIKAKRWTSADSIIAAVLFIHTFSVALQIMIFDGWLYISPRYLLPGSVLGYGWAALFICCVIRAVERRFPDKLHLWRALQAVLLILFAAGNIWQTNKLIYRFRLGKSREVRQFYMDCSAAIKKDWQTRVPVKRPPPEVNAYWYIANRPLKINFLVHNRHNYTATDDKWTTITYMIDGTYDPFGNCLGEADYYAVIRMNSFAVPEFAAETRLIYSRPTKVYGEPGVYEIYGVKR